MPGAPAPSVPEPAGLSAAELGAWLRLLHSPGIGREAVRRLLAAFGLPEAVLAASDSARRAVLGPATAAGLLQPPAGHDERVAATQAWLAAAPRRRLLVLGDADYPPGLLATADPPVFLYLEGDVARLHRPSVAVVGSRRPTPQGRDNARHLAEGLAAQGWTVVSGLAAGIDAAAHEGALRAGQPPQAGGTVAVVGTGLDQVYPRAHTRLARQIVDEGGLLVSEYPLGAPPLAAHFPQRNRLIAGLSRGTLVVEAALQSGSLITARLAAEAGREVLVVPGSILSEQAAGCHALIRQGATLVTSVAEVLDELKRLPDWTDGAEVGAAAAVAAQASLPGLDAAAVSTAQRPPAAKPSPAPPAAPAPQRVAAPAPATAPEDPVLACMGHDPVSLDVLMARSGWPAHQLSAHLLTLELAGWLARLPGGLYQRQRQA